MNKIKEVVMALLSLARAVKHSPADKAKIAAAQKAVADKIRGAKKRDVLNICDAIVTAGFSSESDSMEPDGMGGSKWAPEQSQIYCDCMFRLVEVMKGTELNEVCGRVMGLAMNLATMTSFCRQLKLTEPMPNLLSFEGRNKAARILRPKMPELTKSILALNHQAKELEGQSRYEEAEAARKVATRLNGLYGRMEKSVLPGLERQDPQAMNLGKVLEVKPSSDKKASAD